MNGLHRSLRDAGRYARQVDRLSQRRPPFRRAFESKPEELTLGILCAHRRKLARLLARTVSKGLYEFSPGHVHEIETCGKLREVYSFCLTDLLLHGTVAEMIEEAAAPRLSPQLFSYRKGISWWHAVSQFAAYVRRHRRSVSNPKERGLYVIRRDIDNYTDSIPVHAGSPLWPKLKKLLCPPGASLLPGDWQVIEQVIRPQFYARSGGLACLVRGVPTGQPISCVLFNFYLADLDHELDKIKGGFYGRYSDDLLFAHPEPGVVKKALETITRTLAELELLVKPEKSLDFYLTGAGRKSDVWPEAKPTTRVPFLGMDIWAEGTISLGRDKLRQLLRDIRERACRTARVTRSESPDKIGRIVCSVINQALSAEAAVFEQKSAALLRRAVTDRRQLSQIDYLLGRAVLQAVTGSSNIRELRKIPLQKMRKDWGLLSLLHTRNRWPEWAA